MVSYGLPAPGCGVIAHEDSELHGSDEVNSPDQKKKRLREGGVGPEMRSPAGLTVGILREPVQPVKADSQMRQAVPV